MVTELRVGQTVCAVGVFAVLTEKAVSGELGNYKAVHVVAGLIDRASVEFGRPVYEYRRVVGSAFRTRIVVAVVRGTVCDRALTGIGLVVGSHERQTGLTSQRFEGSLAAFQSVEANSACGGACMFVKSSYEYVRKDSLSHLARGRTEAFVPWQARLHVTADFVDQSRLTDQTGA